MPPLIARPKLSPNPLLKGDFLSLVEKQFACADFDAEHPLYLHLVDKHDLDDVSSLWLCFLYMAFYDEASAWVTLGTCDPFTVPEGILNLPIGTNRRNLWGGKILQHLESLCQQYHSTPGWPAHNFTGDPPADWEILKDNLETIWGNGRFGVYTTAEMLHKVLSYPVEVTGFDNANSSGPADGVRRLYGCSDKLEDLDRCTQLTYEMVLQTGWSPTYTAVDRGVVESVLCNFGAVCRGRYYSGRNIDRQQARILKVEKITSTGLSDLWEARREVFRVEDLGELNGWDGIDKPRLQLYKKTGRIPWTCEER